MVLGLRSFVAMVEASDSWLLFFLSTRPPGTCHQSSDWKPALGRWAACFGFAITSVFGALTVIFLHKGPELRYEIMVKIQGSLSAKPAIRRCWRWFERFKTPGGLEFPHDRRSRFLPFWQQSFWEVSAEPWEESSWGAAISVSCSLEGLFPKKQGACSRPRLPAYDSPFLTS